MQQGDSISAVFGINRRDADILIVTSEDRYRPAVGRQILKGSGLAELSSGASLAQGRAPSPPASLLGRTKVLIQISHGRPAGAPFDDLSSWG
jgi:hypothetical protein